MRPTEFRFMMISLLTSLLTTCGKGLAKVVLIPAASASESHMLTGSCETDFNLDKFQQNIANITTNTIKPSIRVKVSQFSVRGKIILQIRVPKGSEPVYYINNIPYVRVLTTSRPATPVEVKNLRVQYFVSLLQGSVAS